MPNIDFFNQDISFKIPKPGNARAWISEVVAREKKRLTRVNYVFCSDDYLLGLNRQYLNHDTLTDVITFDHSEDEDQIEGDVFISVDRVRENARAFKTTMEEELHRVLVHGVLHLIGYRDKTLAQKSRMREKEDTYLSLRSLPGKS